MRFDIEIQVRYLRCFAIVKPEMVTGLKIEGNSGVRDALQVNSQHLLRHIIVVKLIVTKGHIHFQGQEISERKQKKKL